MPTMRGTVLYLFLEDSLNRIQKRMLDLTDAAPPKLYFTTAVETISGGVTEQTETFLSEHPGKVLIVIDTLQRIKNVSGDMNTYAKDYADTTLLKQIADNHKIAVILIHHLRKQADSDVLT